MNYINENDMMAYYITLLETDQIEFLRGKPKESQEIKQLVTNLKDCKNLHDRIDAAKVLWKRLFEYAMSYIHPDKGGYDDLFAYFDAYVDFEELIFASDSFYRDHTLHCLWVYFLGEYLHFDSQFKQLVQHEQLAMSSASKDLIELMKFYELDGVYYGDMEKMAENIPCNDSIRCQQFLNIMSLNIGFCNNSELTNKLPEEWLHRLFILNQAHMVGIKEDFKNYPREENIQLLTQLGFHYEFKENVGKKLQYCLDFEKSRFVILLSLCRRN